MCKALDDIKRHAEKKGERKGEKKGEKKGAEEMRRRTNILIQRLLAEGRQEDPLHI